MTDFKKKIIDNFDDFVKAKLFVLNKDETLWLEGFIELDIHFEEFVSLLISEIKFSWNIKNLEIESFSIYYIDIHNKNRLIPISNNECYQFVRKLKSIYIVVLHRQIKSMIIENIPSVFGWFMNNYTDKKHLS